MPDGWLIPGERYYWHVRAKDKRGAWSPWSEAWSFVAGPAQGTTPQKPAAALSSRIRQNSGGWR